MVLKRSAALCSLIGFLFIICIDAENKFSQMVSYQHCAKLDTLRESRRIPPLLTNTNATLVHVQTFIRHGARLPNIPSGKCWIGFLDRYDCNTVKPLPGIRKKYKDTLYHTVDRKIKNHWDTTRQDCADEQLTREGSQQHLVTGKITAEAYALGRIYGADVTFNRTTPPSTSLKEFEKVMSPRFEAALVDLKQRLQRNKNLDHLIFFRSTDISRTRLSGSLFVSSFLRTFVLNVTVANLTLNMKTLGAEDLTFDSSLQLYPLHLTIAHRRYLNKNVQRAPLTFLKKYWVLRYKAKSTVFHVVRECLFSSICNNNPLMHWWHPKDVDAALMASTRYFVETWRFCDGLPARIAARHIVMELKSLIVSAYPNNSKAFFSIPEEYDKHKDYTQKNLRYLEGYKPFAIYSAHDDTLLGLLAMFGKRMVDASADPGNHMPSFASMLSFEVVQCNALFCRKRFLYHFCFSPVRYF